jgi:hypothetical protein
MEPRQAQVSVRFDPVPRRTDQAARDERRTWAER